MKRLYDLSSRIWTRLHRTAHQGLRRSTVVIVALMQVASMGVMLPVAKVYADTPPTVASFVSSTFTDSSAASETTSSALSWSTGNVIVAMGVTENGLRTLGVPTATGLTFSQVTSVNIGTGAEAAAYIWSATAGSAGSSVVTSTSDATAGMRGLAVFAYSGSAGLGNTGTLSNSATATAIPLTRANANSAVISSVGDWNAINDTAVTPAPASGGTVRVAATVQTPSPLATMFVTDWTDQGAAGSNNYGVTNFTGGTPDVSGLAVEVRGTGSATLEQEGFRFRNDDGSQTGATWLAAQDTNISRGTNLNTRLRMLVNATSDPPSAQYQLEWRKVSGPTDWRKVSNIAQTGQLIRPVTLGTDDAQQAGTTMTTTATTIGGSLDATTEWAGMRFQSMTIPKGATVTSAFLSVVPSGTGEDEPLVTVYAEDTDNSATFTTTASNLTNRTRTSGVAWSSTDLGATGATYHTSPDLTSQVQSVISRAGWATGNPITILVQGGNNVNRDLTIESFENAGANPPRLTVNYTYPDPAFELAASANVTASGENTTAQLTAPSGKTTSNFTTGRMQDDENPADAVDIASGNYTELEWSIKAMPAVAAIGDIYEFRATNNGTALNTYTVTPQWTIANITPDTPTSLAQMKTTNVSLSTGDWTNETSIKFTATVVDGNAADTIAICAEVGPIATAFTSPGTDADGCGTLAANGATASVTISGLTAETQYHWQLKAKDSVGAYSSWVGYGGNTENPPTNPAARDFGVDVAAPSGGTVYDGSSVGTDMTFNDSSLSSLSANWTGFSFGASGIQKYEYSIGIIGGGITIRGWTDNGTATTVTASGLTLQTSQTYFINIRATDAAGNTAIVSSNGQLVAPSMSFAVAPSSITFNALKPGNAYTDSTKTTTLTASTNAYGGYVVRMATTSNASSGLYTIPAFSGGSYASPAAWGSGTGFGYTTNDADVFTQAGSCPGGGTAPCYAPISLTKPGDIVAAHTANVAGTPITGEVTTIAYRVTVAPTQAASSYTTVLLYTMTAVY